MRADRSGGIGRKGAVMEVATVMDSWRLDERDPLHSHLAQIVLPRAGKAVKHPDFEVGRLSNNGEVYAYQERESRSLFVCKFFDSRWYLSEQERKDGLNYEFKNLSTVRDMGFCKFPYHVVRPLSMDERLRERNTTNQCNQGREEYCMPKPSSKEKTKRRAGCGTRP